ncbi:MAG: VanW family protein [Candidatus Spechtbacterales bacterium]|nr:VanW family protein [Candidatus Spechtbacterales bacterium]
MHLEFDLKLSKKVKTLLIAALALAVMGAVFFTTVYYLNRGEESIQGLMIGSHDVGRMSEEEINMFLAEKVEKQANSPIVIKTEEGGELKTLPSEIGAKHNTQATINDVLSYGKDKGMIRNAIIQSKALFAGANIPLHITIDEKQYTEFIENNLSDINKPAQDASYVYDDELESFKFIPAHSGIIVDATDLNNQIRINLENLIDDPVIVNRKPDHPVVSGEENTLEALATAQKLLGGLPYTIESRTTTWNVEKDDLISWIEFSPSYDSKSDNYILKANLSKKEIENYLIRFSPGLNVPPKNARFAIENGKVNAFNLAQNGYELDVENSADLIATNIMNTQKSTKLSFVEVKPEITNESIDNLGISALIGRGESDFAGSPRSRKHNIQVGSDKFQGLLVAPGEIFSFNENLGPVTGAEGYLPELVIKQGRTVPEYGGGLCQVSTTLFRAAIYGGLEITERFNHSYPVVYYGTPGFDATIYPPHPDLAFRNNTEGHLLIQYEIIGTKLIFEIYGQDDGRKTEVDGPHLYDKRASGAVKAWLKQTVYNESGNIMHEKTFYSNYKSPSLYPVTRNPLE